MVTCDTIGCPNDAKLHVVIRAFPTITEHKSPNWFRIGYLCSEHENTLLRFLETINVSRLDQKPNKV